MTRPGPPSAHGRGASPGAGPPLLVIGHGTRSAAGLAEFGRLINRVRDRGRGRVVGVAGGFIELSDPPLAGAMSQLAQTARGAAHSPDAASRHAPGVAGSQDSANLPPGSVARSAWEVVAVPLMLTAAGHGKGDIPAALARERLRHPGLSYRYGRPLGPHPALLAVLEARIDAALAGAPPGGTHVLLVGRGSTDPDANSEVAKVARLLWEGRGYDAVEYSFISLAEPSVPAALERTRRLGARRIVVTPYFLFPGVLPDRIVTQSREHAAPHPELDVRAAAVLGDCDELADLVLERYAEALAGDIRMNCDTCAYRVPMPGFADKVGRPQMPHFHPAEAHDHGHALPHASSGSLASHKSPASPARSIHDAH
jgi:sirohydrochlorin cobaltochelatase